MKKKFTAIFAILALLMIHTVVVFSADVTIGHSGATERTVTKGSHFELEVTKLNHIDNDNLQWSIADETIITFEDAEDAFDNDDEMEFKALETGTTEITCINLSNNETVVYRVIVEDKSKPSEGVIRIVGAPLRDVSVGQEFELEVKRSKGAKEKHLIWSISDDTILAFEDLEEALEQDDEKEFIALASGTSTVICTNSKTGKKVIFTINVK